MRMTATVRTPEAEALALRMRKHFAHKVPVEVRGAASRVRIPAGEFELEPRGDSLAVRATGSDEEALARVRDVVDSHLARFAREAEVELVWASLEIRSEAWIGEQRNARHLRRTRAWVIELSPDAGEALRLAALLHDVDRVASGIPLAEQVAAWDDERCIAEHAERSARIAAAWLRDAGADDELTHDVETLIRLHEVGGTPEADILQAADSLSFLEVNPAARWVQEGIVDRETALRKLTWMHGRIRLDVARSLATPLLEAAVASIRHSPPAQRVRQHATGGRAHGRTR
jgi:hypothetical protein